MAGDASKALPIVFISAWNESGGGYLHRLFDGHPECLVTPFEIQLGGNHLKDGFRSWFSAKYRWPDFNGTLSSKEIIFDSIPDEETKRAVAPEQNSKHDGFPVNFTLNDLRSGFFGRLNGVIDRPGVVRAYIGGLFDAWKERRSSGRERLYLGHCPTLILDADVILPDLAEAKIIHLVRDPVAGFADFSKRVPDMDPAVYCRKWNLINGLGFYYSEKYPNRVCLASFQNLLEDPGSELRRLSEFIGIEYDPILERATFNGMPLEEMGPFGGVPGVSPEHETDCRKGVAGSVKNLIMRDTAGVRSFFSEISDG